ncbi:MAG: hypothetical protein ACRD0F_01685, partial [Acidimicrobiales bacterium]
MSLGASIEPPVGPVEPGSVAEWLVRVTNEGPGADVARLQVAGAAAAWAWVAPSSLDLGPGTEGQARITVRVPRAPSPPAGRLPYELRVTSATGGPCCTIGGHIEVAAFHAAHASLAPAVAHSRGPADFAVSVDNRGNRPMAVGVTVAAGEGLAASVEPPQLVVAAGATATATVRARPAARTRGQARHGFMVRVEAGDEVIEVPGAL